MPVKETGLGNHAMLTKIDKLRELNVGSLIPLPQLVVVGDQSSGKSSVLESLTGFSFPRAPGLCTRYATQITCCRDPVTSVAISIIPRPDANEELKMKLLGFHRHIDGELDNDELANIFHEANLTMGIRMKTNDISQIGAFSQDILKIEVNGPEQNHLTVIDVPGIFRVPTPGLTTETDITLVENMVKSYMSNRRTIILAVMPCNVDIATQEILKLAEAADAEGTRTMGVLTKPDLATEIATRDAIIDLVVGKKGHLKLGYYVVKNRSADDSSSTLAERAAAEKAFFMDLPWTAIGDRCGISALKRRLRDILMKISKQEFPFVKAEIEQRLRKCEANLESMGPTRADQGSQRQYLGRLATSFQTTTQAALNANYAGERLFRSDPDLKLITRMIKLQNVFANVFREHAHMQQFDASSDANSSSDDNNEVSENRTPPVSNDVDKSESKKTVVAFKALLAKYCELHDIIVDKAYRCPKPDNKPIMDRITEVFDSSRGPDLGTFSGTVLSTIFEEQSEKWEPLTLFHVSNAIALVHDFIFRLLCHLCPEKQVRDQLWDSLLVDPLRVLYRKAMDHARFLLSIERGGRPSTFNHYFNDILQKKRGERLARSLENKSIDLADHYRERSGRYVSLEILRSSAMNKDNEKQVCEDILDIFESYYKVAQKRFVDIVYQQVISHFLLDGDESPVKAFGPDMVMRLNDEQLELIAGEDEEFKKRRMTLQQERVSLSAALKVVRA
ncbi:Interferon-induced GTP-binding protein Mx1 [Tolypocladium ophioglossoides CBS 100239]|uniref:Interferon-induced GTP-binding protein Mx1 n=1 Tax=Tolypocladium ophioglossoides (strain CBS 100239) TaxID=1163406 RepID=A0A0L0N6D9_TOLOC|nr:Interferon-induced GTP-binding protein Mx1 [Tolypocladium ophioglossoides CBS 100239]